MKVVITAATTHELSKIKDALALKYAGLSTQFEVLFHTSGVGILSSTFSLSKLIFDERPDQIMQVGIAGSFDSSIKLASVFAIRQEYLGDTGVQENGQFKDVFDLKFLHDNTAPFSNKALVNTGIAKLNYLALTLVTGITVNEVTTDVKRIEQLKQKYGATVESMEGASLHYACLSTATPFIQIRAVSNYIGERDKSKWKISEALDQLQKVVISYLDKVYELNNHNK
jgi:futalosine hydrolase